MHPRHLLFVSAVLLSQLCHGAECGVAASYRHGTAVTIEFEKSFDLDRGTIFRVAEKKPVRLTVEKGQVSISGKPVPVLALARGDAFFFGGDHYGCSVTHVLRNGVTGLWISDGAEEPVTKNRYESKNFVPAISRPHTKAMARQSLAPNRVDKSPLAAQLQR
jgi:hypothetical protein